MKEQRGHIRLPSDRNPGDVRCGAGFVDAHVHLKDTCCLDAVVDAGVAAVRDAGMKNCERRFIDRTIERSAVPVVVSAGWALYKRGGYGSLFGAPLDSQDDIKTEILKLKNSGAAIIKIIASGLVSLAQPGGITAGGFNRKELALIVREAEDSGLDVMAHANGEQAIIDAAEAGVRSVEHGFFMSMRALDVLARKKVFWVPTVGALERAAEFRKVSKETEDFVSDLIRSHLEMMLYAHGIGVPLAIGTDCVLPDQEYRKKYDAELSYFEQAGIPRRDVLKIACEGGAKLLGLK